MRLDLAQVGKSNQEIFPSPLIAVLEGHTDIVMGVELLPDGRILSCSLDWTLRLWDRESGEPVGLLESHTDGVGEPNC